MAKKSFEQYAVHGFLAMVLGLSVWILSTVHDHAIQLALLNQKVDYVIHQLGGDAGDTATNATARKPLQ